MTALIGRDRELNSVQQALESARQSNGRCCILSGDAGIGKSRLVEEIRSLAARQGFRIFQGNCYEQDASLPYAPWIDALRMSFASLSAQEIGQVLGPLASEFARLLPELTLLLRGVAPDPALEPAAEKYRLFESIARFLTSSDPPRPALIILEDLHWSDSLSLDLFHFLARRISLLPIVLIGTYRTEEPTPLLVDLLSQLGREKLMREITLHPLGRAEIEQMAIAVGIQRVVAVGLVDVLLGVTDGNPLFLEEMLKSLAEQDRLDEWRGLTTAEGLGVPRSIQRMAQQRVARLPEPARTALLQASVIGERFDFDLLRQITAQDEQRLLQALGPLLETRLVRQESAYQFVFAHALTREAVRATMPLYEQASLHNKIAEVLERSYASAVDSHVGELAYHFFRAEAWDKALQYGQRAGERAQALYASREAVVFCTQAIQAAERLGLDPPLPLLRNRARAFELLGEFDGSLHDYETVLALAGRADNQLALCEALVDLGFLWQSRDWSRAADHFQRALDLARKLGEAPLLARTLNRVGNWHLNRGQAGDALSFHMDALELFRRLEDRRGMAHTLDLLGVVSYQMGDAVRGAAYLESALPILRELDDREALVNTLADLTARALRSGTEVLGDINYLQLTALSDEALEVARGFSWYQGEGLALMHGALSLRQLGEYGQAFDRLFRAQALAEASQNRELLARLELMMGGIFFEILALPQARQHLEAGLAGVTLLGSGLLTLAASTQLASVALRQGDLTRARALLLDVPPTDYPDGRELPPHRSRWSAVAELELAQGNAGRALEIIDRLLASTANLVQYGPQAVPPLSRLRAQCLAALGRFDEAETDLKGALRVSARRDERPMLWRLHADLGSLYRRLRRRDEAQSQFVTAHAIIQDLADKIPEPALRDNFLKQALASMPAPHALTPRQAAKGEFGGLTARERQVAACIAHGRSNREIADELVISEKTAERHVANILLKLGFNSRTQIAVWSVEKGLEK